MALARQVEDELVTHNIRMDVEIAPRYSSQSMGTGGPVQKAMHAQVRCMTVHIEKFAGLELHPDMTIWPWLVRHAALFIERFHVRSNKSTAYEDNHGGLQYRGELMPFGETALFRHAFPASGRGAKKAKYGKAALKFEAGVFLGKTVDSNKYLSGRPAACTRRGPRIECPSPTR